MFENAPELLLTLQIETMKKFSEEENPLLLGTELFCSTLENLPIGNSIKDPYPGVFGLEFTNSKEQTIWKKRSASAGSNRPAFCSIPPEFLPLAEVGCNVENGGRGHTTIDFGKILQTGLRPIWERLAQSDTIFDKCPTGRITVSACPCGKAKRTTGRKRTYHRKTKYTDRKHDTGTFTCPKKDIWSFDGNDKTSRRTNVFV